MRCALSTHLNLCCSQVMFVVLTHVVLSGGTTMCHITNCWRQMSPPRWNADTDSDPISETTPVVLSVPDTALDAREMAKLLAEPL